MLPPLAASELHQQLSLYSIVISEVPASTQLGHLLHSLQLLLQSLALCQQQRWQTLLQLTSPQSQSNLMKTGPALPGVSTPRNANIAKVSHFGLSALLCVHDILLEDCNAIVLPVLVFALTKCISIVTLSVAVHTCAGVSQHTSSILVLQQCTVQMLGRNTESVSISAALFSMFKHIPVFPIP